MSDPEYNKRYESIVKHAPHGLAIVSVDGSWLEVNERLCQITGRKKKIF